MIKKIIAGVWGLLLCISAVYGQHDTVRILQYNLLNYGNSANPATYKDPRLSTIINFVHPDIFGANEIANSAAHAQNILNTVLGQGWEKGAYVNTGNEVQTNMLFWRTDKFGLKSQKSISYKLRDIIAFNLYYKDANLAQTKDTVFFTVIVAHLKAGNTSQDKADRAAETQTVVNYLNSLGKSGNYFFMGDFNLYTSDETAYGNLINNPNADGKLYDPISRPGNWSGNSGFADIHTQSTRTTSLPDGGASGGLDDRFDHIMVSNAVMQNEQKCMYLQDSYKALAQDGKHLNKAITSSPSNPDVPSNVVQALYEMSDHLPVYADFVITTPQFPSGIAGKGVHTLKDIKVTNPFNEKLIFATSGFDINELRVKITLCTIDGRVLLNNIALTGNEVLLPSGWLPGIYVLQLKDATGNIMVRKIVKE